ncbi:MAG: glycosyltransferase family 8 protein [Rickettsiales bacterium]|nr:glycosyltransferase family 8 protein [Rickettsiales bacterium]
MKDNKENITIYFVGAPKMTPLTAVAITSIALNTKSPLDIYILDCDMAANDMRILQAHCAKYENIKNLRFIGIDCAEFEGCAKWSGSLSIWARFLFPKLVPDVKKAIYLDSDLIAMGDIKTLWDLDLDGFAMAAGPEIHLVSPNYGGPSEFYKRLAALGLSEKHLYFCSGVLVLDCDKWRRKNLGDKVIEIGRQYGKTIIYPDQDALNILFGENKYKVIEAELCATTSDAMFLEYEIPERFHDMQKQLVIRHYNFWKPWQADQIVPHYGASIPHADNFWHYAKLAGLADYFLFLQNKRDFSSRPPRFRLKLFGFIPLIRVETRGRIKKIYLFNLIPLAKVKV